MVTKDNTDKSQELSSSERLIWKKFDVGNITPANIRDPVISPILVGLAARANPEVYNAGKKHENWSPTVREFFAGWGIGSESGMYDFTREWDGNINYLLRQTVPNSTIQTANKVLEEEAIRRQTGEIGTIGNDYSRLPLSERSGTIDYTYGWDLDVNLTDPVREATRHTRSSAAALDSREGLDAFSSAKKGMLS